MGHVNIQTRCAGNDPSVKVSVLVMCILSFVYNSAKVGKCYIVNLITYSTLKTVNCKKGMKHIFAHSNFFIDNSYDHYS